VRYFYQNLFKYADTNEAWCQAEYAFPSLPKDILEQLVSPITDVKVACALFIMNAWKAPGPDGLLAVQTVKWKTLRARREGSWFPISCLWMTCCNLVRTSEVQMICVKNVLGKFCFILGQAVSIEKTSVLFSKNVSRSLHDKLTAVDLLADN
jgi:hypothetical protein